MLRPRRFAYIGLAFTVYNSSHIIGRSSVDAVESFAWRTYDKVDDLQVWRYAWTGRHDSKNFHENGGVVDGPPKFRYLPDSGSDININVYSIEKFLSVSNKNVVVQPVEIKNFYSNHQWDFISSADFHTLSCVNCGSVGYLFWRLIRSGLCYSLYNMPL